MLFRAIVRGVARRSGAVLGRLLSKSGRGHVEEISDNSIVLIHPAYCCSRTLVVGQEDPCRYLSAERWRSLNRVADAKIDKLQPIKFVIGRLRLRQRAWA